MTRPLLCCNLEHLARNKTGFMPLEFGTQADLWTSGQGYPPTNTCLLSAIQPARRHAARHSHRSWTLSISATGTGPAQRPTRQTPPLSLHQKTRYLEGILFPAFSPSVRLLVNFQCNSQPSLPGLIHQVFLPLRPGTRLFARWSLALFLTASSTVPRTKSIIVATKTQPPSCPSSTASPSSPPSSTRPSCPPLEQLTRSRRLPQRRESSLPDPRRSTPILPTHRRPRPTLRCPRVRSKTTPPSPSPRRLRRPSLPA